MAMFDRLRNIVAALRDRDIALALDEARRGINPLAPMAATEAAAQAAGEKEMRAAVQAEAPPPDDLDISSALERDIKRGAGPDDTAEAAAQAPPAAAVEPKAQKKSVRFADELEQVKIFEPESDEPAVEDSDNPYENADMSLYSSQAETVVEPAAEPQAPDPVQIPFDKPDIFAMGPAEAPASETSSDFHPQSAEEWDTMFDNYDEVQKKQSNTSEGPEAPPPEPKP